MIDLGRSDDVREYVREYMRMVSTLGSPRAAAIARMHSFIAIPAFASLR
jgi:hypothetical protein